LSPLGARLDAPARGAWQVQLTDPARSVMTDFNEHGLVTVAPEVPIDEALEMMRHAGVRSAFVTTPEKDQILGLITAYDIMGEKPLRFVQHSGVGHDEVTVADLMEPAAHWNVARLEDVSRALVRDLLATFAKYGGTHVAVVEQQGDARRLRGVFSSAKLLRLTENARRVARLQGE
jgi:CBS domain-containing protein